jgi:hypothetical protein
MLTEDSLGAAATRGDADASHQVFTPRQVSSLLGGNLGISGRCGCGITAEANFGLNT